MQIQNGRHEMTKVNISSVIIEIETILFTKPYVFGIKEYNKKTILLFYIIIMQNSKWRPYFFVNPFVIINWDREDIISLNRMFSI